MYHLGGERQRYKAKKVNAKSILSLGFLYNHPILIGLFLHPPLSWEMIYFNPFWLLWSRFLNLGTADILGQEIICCGGCSVCCRVYDSIPASSHWVLVVHGPHRVSCDNQKHPQTLLHGP